MPPLHVHRRDDETFYVLEGELDPAVLGQAAAKAGIEILGPPGALPA